MFLFIVCSDVCGSVDYIAPEILQDNPVYCPKKADVWSLGKDREKKREGWNVLMDEGEGDERDRRGVEREEEEPLF